MTVTEDITCTAWLLLSPHLLRAPGAVGSVLQSSIANFAGSMFYIKLIYNKPLLMDLSVYVVNYKDKEYIFTFRFCLVLWPILCMAYLIKDYCVQIFLKP